MPDSNQSPPPLSERIDPEKLAYLWGMTSLPFPASSQPGLG
jgi:hypothetical protein